MKGQFSIQKLNPKESSLFAELIEVFANVFEMIAFDRPSIEYLNQLLSNEDFLVFVALENNRVIGGLTAYKLRQYYLEKSVIYVYDLAFSVDKQRHGIGQELMAQIVQWSKENGHAEVFVQADRIDDYALDFYRKTKPSTEEDVVHYTYALDPYFKKLFG